MNSSSTINLIQPIQAIEDPNTLHAPDELVDENRDRYLVFTPEGSYYSRVHYEKGG